MLVMMSVDERIVLSVCLLWQPPVLLLPSSPLALPSDAFTNIGLLSDFCLKVGRSKFYSIRISLRGEE